MKIYPTEEQEQRALAQWLDLHRICWCHVPNGSFKGKAAAGIFKALGLKAGVPDILIFDSPPNAPEKPGMAIEMKRVKGGTVSPEQKAWLYELEKRGWAAQVCRGADEAIKALEAHGYGKRK